METGRRMKVEHSVLGEPIYRKELNDMTIKIILNTKQHQVGKLADAELHFTEGPLSGLKLLGFAVWERRNGGYNVTLPSRRYRVNGELRGFALLRPIADSEAQDRIRELILAAYHEAVAMLKDVR